MSPFPASTAVPDWLPPWNDLSAREAKLAEQCPQHRIPFGYANATLCGNNEFSRPLRLQPSANRRRRCGDRVAL